MYTSLIMYFIQSVIYLYVYDRTQNILRTFPLVYAGSFPTCRVYLVENPFANFAQVVASRVYDSTLDSVRKVLLVVFYSQEGAGPAVTFHSVTYFQRK